MCLFSIFLCCFSACIQNMVYIFVDACLTSVCISSAFFQYSFQVIAHRSIAESAITTIIFKAFQTNVNVSLARKKNSLDHLNSMFVCIYADCNLALKFPNLFGSELIEENIYIFLFVHSKSIVCLMISNISIFFLVIAHFPEF